MFSGVSNYLFAQSKSNPTVATAVLPDEESLILDVYLFNETQKATPGVQIMGHLGYLRNGMPKPGLSEFSQAVSEKLPYMILPERAGATIDQLTADFDHMYRYESRREFLKTFYHEIIIGNTAAAKRAFNGFVKIMFQKKHTEQEIEDSQLIVDFMIAMMIANAVQSMKTFLIHFNRYAPKEEVNGFYLEALPCLIESGKTEMLEVFLASGGVQSDMKLQNGYTMLVTTLHHIHSTSLQMSWLLDEMKVRQVQLHAASTKASAAKEQAMVEFNERSLYFNKNQRTALIQTAKSAAFDAKKVDEMINLTLQTRKSQLDYAQKILTILVQKYHANPDFQFERKKRGEMNQDKLAELVHLDVTTARELARAYSWQLDIRDEIDEDGKTQLKSLYEMVSMAPEIDLMTSATDKVSGYVSAAINTFK